MIATSIVCLLTRISTNAIAILLTVNDELVTCKGEILTMTALWHELTEASVLIDPPLVAMISRSVDGVSLINMPHVHSHYFCLLVGIWRGNCSCAGLS